MPLRKQQKLIQLFHNLMVAGFNLTEMVDFLERSQLMPMTQVAQMREGLMAGQSFSGILATMGFSDDVITQISLSEVHGNTQGALQEIEGYLGNLIRVRQKVFEVATYPVLLLGFLVLIMLGLKNYLLPQLDSDNAATWLVSHFPMLFFIFLGLNVFTVGVVMILVKLAPPLKVWSRLAGLPFLGKIVQLYLTAYYAREWGNLLSQGIELVDIVSLMQGQKSRLFNDMGKDIEAALLLGQSFHGKISSYPFFLKELGLIIAYGEIKAKLGAELTIYAKETWETFFKKLNKATQIIQPVIFLFVALMIVMIYAAMLLPIYQNMEGYF